MTVENGDDVSEYNRGFDNSMSSRVLKSEYVVVGVFGTLEGCNIKNYSSLVRSEQRK